MALAATDGLLLRLRPDVPRRFGIATIVLTLVVAVKFTKRRPERVQRQRVG